MDCISAGVVSELEKSEASKVEIGSLDTSEEDSVLVQSQYSLDESTVPLDQSVLRSIALDEKAHYPHNTVG